MKKLLFLAIAMTLVVAAGAFAQQTTLNFLWYQDANSAGWATDQRIWQKFKDDNPDINLQQEILFSEAYHQKLGALIAANQMPDVFYLWPGLRASSATVQSQKLAKDLRPLLGDDFLSNFSAAALDVKQQASGILMELPQSFTYTTVMYTNNKLLSDLKIPLPKTYAALKAMVLKLKVKNIQTVLLPDGDGWPAMSTLFSTIMGRYLGDTWVAQVNSGKAKFTDVGFVNALKFYQQMYTDQVISWTNIQQPYGDGPGLFANGRAAFFVDGDWRQGAFVTDLTTGKAMIPPDKQASDFSFQILPALPNEKYPGVLSGVAGTGLGVAASIPSGSDVEKAAVKLLKYYYGPEVQQLQLETGAYIPSRKNVTSEKLDPFTVMMSKFYTTIKKSSAVIDNVFDPNVVSTLNAGLQAIGLGAQTPAQVAAAMQKDQDAYLKTLKK